MLMMLLLRQGVEPSLLLSLVLLFFISLPCFGKKEWSNNSSSSTRCHHHLLAELLYRLLSNHHHLLPLQFQLSDIVLFLH